MKNAAWREHKANGREEFGVSGAVSGMRINSRWERPERTAQGYVGFAASVAKQRISPSDPDRARQAFSASDGPMP
jgi:hypothetical protein